MDKNNETFMDIIKNKIKFDEKAIGYITINNVDSNKDLLIYYTF